MRSAQGQADASPVPFNNMQVSREVSLMPSQSGQQHKRADSAPLSALEAELAQLDQHSEQFKRQSLQFSDTIHDSMESHSTPSTVRRQASTISVKLEKDRESVQGLADYLKNNDPPPSSFMSIPESFEFISPSRKSPFKIFTRRTSRKDYSDVRQMRLPDSAVAQKTTSGKWHIAISIPIEHDHMPEPPAQRPELQASFTSRSGPITVLKPVMETHELPKPVEITSLAAPRESSITPQRQTAEKFSSPIDAEDTRIFQNYYRQQTIHDLASKFETPETKLSHSPRFRKDFVGTTPEQSRPQSQITDYRHSGGTVYSDASMLNDMGHSRGASSASSAPSATALNFNAMKGMEPISRFSSVTSKKGSPLGVAPSGRQSPSSTVIGSPSVADSIDSDISLALFGKADTAQSYGLSDGAGAHMTLVRPSKQTTRTSSQEEVARSSRRKR